MRHTATTTAEVPVGTILHDKSLSTAVPSSNENAVETGATSSSSATTTTILEAASKPKRTYKRKTVPPPSSTELNPPASVVVDDVTTPAKSTMLSSPPVQLSSRANAAANRSATTMNAVVPSTAAATTSSSSAAAAAAAATEESCRHLVSTTPSPRRPKPSSVTPSSTSRTSTPLLLAAMTSFSQEPESMTLFESPMLDNIGNTIQSPTVFGMSPLHVPAAAMTTTDPDVSTTTNADVPGSPSLLVLSSSTATAAPSTSVSSPSTIRRKRKSLHSTSVHGDGSTIGSGAGVFSIDRSLAALAKAAKNADGVPYSSLNILEHGEYLAYEQILARDRAGSVQASLSSSTTTTLRRAPLTSEQLDRYKAMQERVRAERALYAVWLERVLTMSHATRYSSIPPIAQQYMDNLYNAHRPRALALPQHWKHCARIASSDATPVGGPDQLKFQQMLRVDGRVPVATLTPNTDLLATLAKAIQQRNTDSSNCASNVGSPSTAQTLSCDPLLFPPSAASDDSQGTTIGPSSQNTSLLLRDNNTATVNFVMSGSTLELLVALFAADAKQLFDIPVRIVSQTTTSNDDGQQKQQQQQQRRTIIIDDPLVAPRLGVRVALQQCFGQALRMAVVSGATQSWHPENGVQPIGTTTSPATTTTSAAADKPTANPTTTSTNSSCHAYTVWQLGTHRLCIRVNYTALLPINHKLTTVQVKPHLVEGNGEEFVREELARYWTGMVLNGDQHVLLGHVLPWSTTTTTTSSSSSSSTPNDVRKQQAPQHHLLQLEHLTLNQMIPPEASFQPIHAIRHVQRLCDRLATLAPGTYLLRRATTVAAAGSSSSGSGSGGNFTVPYAIDILCPVEQQWTVLPASTEVNTATTTTTSKSATSTTTEADAGTKSDKPVTITAPAVSKPSTTARIKRVVPAPPRAHPIKSDDDGSGSDDSMEIDEDMDNDEQQEEEEEAEQDAAQNDEDEDEVDTIKDLSRQELEVVVTSEGDTLPAVASAAESIPISSLVDQPVYDLHAVYSSQSITLTAASFILPRFTSTLTPHIPQCFPPSPLVTPVDRRCPDFVRTARCTGMQWPIPVDELQSTTINNNMSQPMSDQFVLPSSSSSTLSSTTKNTNLDTTTSIPLSSSRPATCMFTHWRTKIVRYCCEFAETGYCAHATATAGVSAGAAGIRACPYPHLTLYQLFVRLSRPPNAAGSFDMGEQPSAGARASGRGGGTKNRGRGGRGGRGGAGRGRGGGRGGGRGRGGRGGNQGSARGESHAAVTDSAEGSRRVLKKRKTGGATAAVSTASTAST